MDLKITAKQLGKKKSISTQIITIENFTNNPILLDLITNIVKQQVNQFNTKIEKENILPFISKEEIIRQKEAGKVSFGDMYNDTKADEAYAIENALLAFTDGLFCVFIDNEQIETLDQKIKVSEESTISFVRLTFLAGSIW